MGCRPVPKTDLVSDYRTSPLPHQPYCQPTGLQYKRCIAVQRIVRHGLSLIVEYMGKPKVRGDKEKHLKTEASGTELQQH